MKFIKKYILFGFVTLFIISCSDDSLNLQDSGTKENLIESANTEGYNEERNLILEIPTFIQNILLMPIYSEQQLPLMMLITLLKEEPSNIL